jgi:hypothetical protein
MTDVISRNAAPRAIFLSVCEEIAQAFAGNGFKFAISGPHLTKVTDNFKFRISFASSHDNRAGIYVALWMYASIRNLQLQQWRKRQSHPYRSDDWVAGGTVHVLADKKYFEWNLAEDAKRAAVVADGIGFIRAYILPYFNTFSDPGLVISKLCHSEIPAFEIGSAIEFAMCFSNKDQAQRVLTRFILERKDLADQIEISTCTFRERGFPPFQATSYADQVAWVRRAYGLS